MDKFSSVTVDISGGYDSRAILATVSQFDKSVKANTIALITGDESETAMDVAEACGVEIIHHHRNRKRRWVLRCHRTNCYRNN